MKQVLLMPIFLYASKKDTFLTTFTQRNNVPARELRHALGSKHYYNFLKQIKELNKHLKTRYPGIQPLFQDVWEENPKTGRERKVIKKDPNVAVTCNSNPNLVLAIKQ